MRPGFWVALFVRYTGLNRLLRSCHFLSQNKSYRQRPMIALQQKAALSIVW